MHDKFLFSLAKKCKAQYGSRCDKLTVIFPNKRAGIYFVDYLSQQYGYPIWSPQIMSFEEYVEKKQTITLTDNLQILFELYHAYGEIVKQPETFDVFFPWGEMILTDFNDIDNYLVDTVHIFQVIKSQKELDESFRYLAEEDQEIIQKFWKGFLPIPNKQQNEFIKTWAILTDLYTKFNANLQAKCWAYKGKMFRDFASNLSPKNIDKHPIWFVGFNALTKAEEKIIKTLIDYGNVDIHWDIDRYYFDDIQQEAGLFFRQYNNDMHFKASIARDMKNHVNTSDKKIDVIAAPFAQGQLMAASQQLHHKQLINATPSQQLIILPDPSMLTGLLNILPHKLAEVNVTMGWPIGQSRIYVLISKVIALQQSKWTNNSEQFGHAEVMTILEFSDFLLLSKDKINAFHQNAIKEKKYYHDIEALRQLHLDLGKLLTFSSTTKGLIHILISYLASLDYERLPKIEQLASVHLLTILKRINQTLEGNEIALALKSFQKLYSKLGISTKLPLSGNPNSSIQVMGILETRNLSFDQVMIIGMNEGAWPKSSANTSFIPYNIKKAFNLPTTEHRDAMQSYLFYRLLQSTDNIWVSYNNISEFNHNGELSRLIRQMDYESSITINYSQLSSPVVAEKHNAIEIRKDQKVLDLLSAYQEKGGKIARRFSPSALNTYLDCRLKFYFQQIARIQEPNVLKEDIDSSLFGNLFHGTMEYFYKDKKNWYEADYSDIDDQLNAALSQAFLAQSIDLTALGAGRQLIAYEVIHKFAKQILTYDKANTPFELISLEKKYIFNFPIITEFQEIKIGLMGIIDRIDLFHNKIRILDYKSGRDGKQFTDIESLTDRNSKYRNKAVFQLFYYCLLYKENQAIKIQIQPGLFNSKDLFKLPFDPQVFRKDGKSNLPVMNYDHYAKAFKKILHNMLLEIFDPKIPFDQTEDLKKCEYCIYKEICMRN